MLKIDTSSPVPLWSQLEEGARHLVASGEWRPGQAVPSVRDLARALRVNPATVAKAYQRLVERGVLESHRGSGTFVVESPPSLSRADRERLLAEAAGRLAALATTTGASREEALAALTRAWDGLQRGRKGVEA